jgi:sugar lactone lactonase YvrE
MIGSTTPPPLPRPTTTALVVAVLYLVVAFCVSPSVADMASQVCASQLLMGNTSTLNSLTVGGITDVVMAPNGNTLYVANAQYHDVRKVDVTTGAATVAAGVNSQAGWRDTGTGTNVALFNYPYALAITSTGNTLYIADYNNGRIRKLDLVGTQGVTTIAGGGTGTCVDGVGTSASLTWPAGLALNSNNTVLYFAERGCHVVRALTLATGLVRTLIGSPPGSAASGYKDGIGLNVLLNGPTKLVLTADGRTMYVSDSDNQDIRKVIVASKVVTTVFGAWYINTASARVGYSGHVDDFGTYARLSTPTGLALSRDQTVLYIADSNGQSVRAAQLATGQVTTIAGFYGSTGGTEGVGTGALFNTPHGVALNPANTVMYVAEYTPNRLRKVQLAPIPVTYNVGTTSTFAGGGSRYSGGPARSLNFGSTALSGIAMSADEQTIYVASYTTGNIQSIKMATGNATLVAGSPAGVQSTAASADGVGAGAGFNSIQSMAMDRANGLLYVVENVGRVRQVNPTTLRVVTVVGTYGCASDVDGVGTSACIPHPTDVAVSSTGSTLYVRYGMWWFFGCGARR